LEVCSVVPPTASTDGLVDGYASEKPLSPLANTNVVPTAAACFRLASMFGNLTSAWMPQLFETTCTVGSFAAAFTAVSMSAWRVLECGVGPASQNRRCEPGAMPCAYSASMAVSPQAHGS